MPYIEFNINCSPAEFSFIENSIDGKDNFLFSFFNVISFFLFDKNQKSTITIKS